MDAETEALARERLDGDLDEPGRRRLAELLERDPRALGEFADQLQIHHRLREALRDQAPPTAEAVLREIRFLGDSPRFSEEVVRRLKGGTGRGARWGRWGMVAACLAIAVAAAFHFARPGGGTLPASGRPLREVLLVVGRLPLQAGDAEVKERLERLGLAVTVKNGLELTAADTKGRALVAVSSTSVVADAIVFSPNLVLTLRNLDVPLLTWEPMLLFEFGMTPGGVHQVDWAGTQGQTHLVIADPAHPLAAGLSGRIPATKAPSRFSWGRAGGEAIKIAALEGNPSRTAIFGYDRGARMPGGAAPARRVSLFLFEPAASVLTDQGWALFDAAVQWCTDAK
jgi:hypothetical protein